ncbi:MAG TPA: phosphonoacetaldehyde reductase [Firmicutes bacterium]|nr:phosphonoacetaldehyde reductase [Bacillota bacterium]
MNRYYNPVRFYQGKGVLSMLPEVLKERQAKRVLVIGWNESVFSLSGVKEIKNNSQWEQKQLVFQASNPRIDQLFAVYEETKEFAPDTVVAIGGGSILDVGKSLCCLYGKEIDCVETLRTHLQEKDLAPDQTVWIAIPTTAGTGSEATCWATIWDPEQEKKRSLESQDNYAYAALVDPDVLEGMPLRLAVSSGLDALAHAVESYWACGTNGVSHALALQAIRVMNVALKELSQKNPLAHEQASFGSMLAGMAFSNTRTTACHSMSYPLTMTHQIPHGVAVSMLLGPVLDRNLPAIKDSKPLLEALEVENGTQWQKKIRTILRQAGLADSLSAWGIGEEELPHLAQMGNTKGRADNNPVAFDTTEMTHILQEIYQ